ncbi:myelin-associated glycoprotein-like [Sinocyclocheilus anshuiensis]|uniref:myelin-associated glycoprotein-like n=1 Tax=Sinocyclocheilus anshuiensis TaxID=1608454 RepID=UPI0007B9B103|nr:PREDICTED: myelin-associated glycoprotein-like [Sinocyclocheilus anshuiensis]XP_016345539.1 PREDICTED: myelin-associated glycoprotein-like [Sinocyclocheilus anshuiensis]
MSSTLRTLMAGNQITSFIFISSVLVHTHSADNIYSAVMPQTVTALTGSCVQIPCTFNISNFEDKRKNATSIYGIWLKNKSQFADKDGLIAFNSSKNIIRGFSDIQMTGYLTERNCTTLFYNIMMNHSDSYYFRLEMEPDVFKATFNPSQDVSSKTVRINVRDSPQPPELKPNYLTVKEGTTVNLSCSAEAPCPKQPPTISWSNIPESAHITTQLQEKPDKTQSVFSYMTFKASYKDHRKSITCTATYPRNTSDASTVESTMMLQVLFPPKETRVIITSVGTNVTLTCESHASPSNDLNYTWYKHGEERPIAWGTKINLTETPIQTGSYFCIAQNKHGKQSSEEAQRTDEEQSGLSHLVIYGCTGGLLTFVLLSAVFFYCMRTKASRQARVSDQAEDKNRDTMAIYANNATVISKNGEKKETDDLHYGEIDFSKLQTGHKTKEHSNNGPETEYAELQVIERKRQINGAQQMDKLYAQVQKK